MIERLTSLEIRDFRVFGGEHKIPLDADAILVHGNNGSGKSSLLYAIEYALTGEVADLKGFAQDYPRCLRHVDATSPTSVRLSFREDNGIERQTFGLIPMTANEPGAHEFLTAGDARFFKERCFLSQVRLSRLLELYQTIGEGSSETPLVAFVKRLLNLDVLENLSQALHEITDVRRVRKVYPRFAELEQLQLRLAEKQRRLREDIRVAEGKQQEQIAVVGTLLNSIARPLSSDNWNLENVQQLYAALVLELNAGSAEVRLRSLESSLNTLRGLRVILANDQTSDDEVVTLQKSVNDDTSRLEELRAILTTVLRSLLERVALLQPSMSLAPGEALPTELWTSAALALESLLTAFSTAVSSLVLVDKARKEADERRTHLQTQLEDVSSRLARATATLPRGVDLLAEIVAIVDGDVCPVCERDFRELKRESLREFVARRVAEFGVQNDAIQALTMERDTLRLGIEESARVVTTMVERQQRSDPTEVVLARLRQAESLEAQLKAIQPQLTEWQTIWDRVRATRAQLSLSQSRQQQISDAKAKIGDLAMALAVSFPVELSLLDRVEVLSKRCLENLGEEQQRQSSWRKTIDILDEIVKGFQTRASLDKEWLSLDRELQQCQSAREKADGYISSGRRVHKAAIEAKRKLLERVFDQRLNSLWADLFDRLVRNERFRPRLGDPAGWRDQIRTAIQAVADGCETFENIGAIHSLGNLNTAALSLFLSLNLVESAQNQVLVLDDPVQSMDDVHVTQMGLLLRELISQAGRQMVVAVHERALFDFLAFEFSARDFR